jgi:hypothetical protein
VRKKADDEPAEYVEEPTAVALAQVGVMLPRATMKMLDAEAAYYGWRRSTFLEALLLHKLGRGLRLERQPDAPKYKFKRADWTTNVRYIWYLRPDLKTRFDDLRLRAGNIRPQAWIVLAVNEFVGLPTVT